MKHNHFTLKGRKATAAVLALALCGAVYLNWSFAREAPESVAVLGETETQAVETAAQAQPVAAVLDPLAGDTAVSAETEDGVPVEETANKNYGEAQLVSVNKDTGTEFFEQARLSRTKTRDEALDALKKALKSATLSEEEKKELTEKLDIEVNNITLESKLETLLKSKGFADCVVALDGKKANVTVMTENDALTAAEVTRIRDALLNQCHGMTAQDITVVEVK